MKIGVLSDSHGRAARTGQAVALLRAHGADLLIHLGDFETRAVVDELVGQPARLVFGNCDDVRDLAAYATAMDLSVDHPAGEIAAAGRRIGFTHGHIESTMVDLLERGVDYLFHGHTHQLRDEMVGSTRVINPGALHRASRYTVALLDPETDALKVLTTPR